jgi:DNA-binding transcriptional regulator YbjK
MPQDKEKLVPADLAPDDEYEELVQAYLNLSDTTRNRPVVQQQQQRQQPPAKRDSKERDSKE